MTNDECEQSSTHSNVDSSDPSSDTGTRNRAHLRRRHLLKGMGAGFVTTSLAGCSLFGPEKKEFTAQPKGIPAEKAIDLGYKTMDHLRLPVERRVTGGEESLVASIENHAVVYKSEHLSSRPPYPFAVLSAPSAEVSDRELNPFLAEPFENLLSREAPFEQSSGTNGAQAPMSVGDLHQAGFPGPIDGQREGWSKRSARERIQRESRMGSVLADHIRYRDAGWESSIRRQVTTSSTETNRDDEDPNRAGPPSPPLAKLLGTDGLDVVGDEITGWIIPPQLLNETTQTIHGRDVGTKTFVGVTGDEDIKRVVELELAKTLTSDEGDDTLLLRGRNELIQAEITDESDYNFEAEFDRSDDKTSAVDPKSFSEYWPSDMISETGNDGIRNLDPDQESKKMPGKPDNGPDIAISASGPSTVRDGAELTYKVQVENKGTAPGSPVIIRSQKEFESGGFRPWTPLRTSTTKGDSEFPRNRFTSGIRTNVGELDVGEVVTISETIVPHLKGDATNPVMRNVFEVVDVVLDDATDTNNSHTVTTQVLSTGAVLSVTVTDTEAAALEGATVRIPIPAGDDLTATTDARGSVQFQFTNPVPPSSLVVIAEKDDYRTASKAVYNRDTEDVVVQLERNEDDTPEKLADWDPATEPIEVAGTGSKLVGPFDIPEGKLTVFFELEADPEDDSLIYTQMSQIWDNNLDGIYAQARGGDVPITSVLSTTYEGETTLEESAIIDSMGGRLKLEIKGTGGDWKLTLTPKPAPRHTIEGLVFEEDSTSGEYQRAEGVFVTAVDDRGNRFTARTGQRGGFRVAVFNFRNYRLHFTKPGFTPVSTRVFVDDFLRIDKPHSEDVQAGSVRLDRREDR